MRLYYYYIMKEFEINDIVVVLGQCAQENWDIIDFYSDFICYHSAPLTKAQNHTSSRNFLVGEKIRLEL